MWLTDLVFLPDWILFFFRFRQSLTLEIDLIDHLGVLFLFGLSSLFGKRRIILVLVWQSLLGNNFRLFGNNFSMSAFVHNLFGLQIWLFWVYPPFKGIWMNWFVIFSPFGHILVYLFILNSQSLFSSDCVHIFFIGPTTYEWRQGWHGRNIVKLIVNEDATSYKPCTSYRIPFEYMDQ